MTFEQCERCGYGNEAGAEWCENCRAELGRYAPSDGVAYAPAAGAYAPGEAPAGRLPLDFAVSPFRSLGDVLQPTFRLYREHLGAIAKIVLVAAPAQAVFDFIGTRSGELLTTTYLFTWVATNGISALVTGALIYALMTLFRTGAAPPLKESFAWGLRKWWKLFVCTLLVSVMTGVGTMLLCLPGLLAMTVFAVALPAAAVEGLGPLAALERSVMLTKGYRWLIFGTIFLAVIMLTVPILLWTFTSTPPTGLGAQLLLAIVQGAVVQLLSSIVTVISLFIYLGLRAGRGEVDAPPLFAPPGG